MKIFKRITSVVVAIAMIVTLCAVNPSTSVEAKVKIQYGKKLTISVGKKDQIYVKGSGATFTSSNKKVATVDKKGNVKGKKVGTCKITIKQNGSKATSSVTVVPANVTIKSAKATSTTKAKITWKKVKGVSGYYIYRSTKKNSGYKKVATVKGASKTSYTVSKLAEETTYYFKVKAYGKAGKKTVTSKKYSGVKSVTTAKTWKLVWSDEFNGTSLNMNNWSYETGATGWGNEEFQDYTAGDNVKFDGNNLIIIPRMTITTDAKGKKTTSYTSTRINTKNKQTFKYGKIEIRAKAAKGQGTWSAGWMLGDGTGDSRGWPYDGEIDLMEAMNGGVPQTIHCEYWNNQAWSHGNKNYSTGLTQAKCAEDFHTYGMTWTDKYIQFTVDGVNKGLFDPSLYSSSIYDQIWKGEFDHPFFFILNCAIGGNAAGQVSTNGWTQVKNTATEQVYEDYFYVDYVRVYQ